MKYIIIIIFFVILSGCSRPYSSNIDAVFSDVSPMVEEANLAFSKAEAKILAVDNDDIVRPDPDASKCPCKGTGIIKHGDDHVTQCPYHGKTTQILKR